jgi:hypothetical protein
MTDHAEEPDPLIHSLLRSVKPEERDLHPFISRIKAAPATPEYFETLFALVKATTQIDPNKVVAELEASMSTCRKTATAEPTITTVQRDPRGQGRDVARYQRRRRNRVPQGLATLALVFIAGSIALTTHARGPTSVPVTASPPLTDARMLDNGEIGSISRRVTASVPVACSTSGPLAVLAR